MFYRPAESCPARYCSSFGSGGGSKEVELEVESGFGSEVELKVDAWVSGAVFVLLRVLVIALSLM